MQNWKIWPLGRNNKQTKIESGFMKQKGRCSNRIKKGKMDMWSHEAAKIYHVSFDL